MSASTKRPAPGPVPVPVTTKKSKTLRVKQLDAAPMQTAGMAEKLKEKMQEASLAHAQATEEYKRQCIEYEIKRVKATFEIVLGTEQDGYAAFYRTLDDLVEKALKKGVPPMLSIRLAIASFNSDTKNKWLKEVVETKKKLEQHCNLARTQYKTLISAQESNPFNIFGSMTPLAPKETNIMFTLAITMPGM